jgi:UV DNA damage endonuclease
MNSQFSNHIGYAGICTSIERQQKSWNYSQYIKDTKINGIDKTNLILIDKVSNNLQYIIDCLEWNLKHDIYMFRASSNIIPLATHPEVNVNWQTDYNLKLCKKIKQLVEDNNIRLSFHPDPKCISLTNWNDKELARKSYDELKYHYKLCKLLGAKDILIHAGASQKGLCKKLGITESEGKQLAIETAISNIKKFDKRLLEFIVIENDEYSMNINDVIHICKETNTKPCLDVHHWRFQPVEFELQEIISLWGCRTPKMHLSSSKEGLDSLVRSHSDYIDIKDWELFLKLSQGKCDVILEAKAKEFSVLQLRNKLNNLKL